MNRALIRKAWEIANDNDVKRSFSKRNFENHFIASPAVVKNLKKKILYKKKIKKILSILKA